MFCCSHSLQNNKIALSYVLLSREYDEKLPAGFFSKVKLLCSVIKSAALYCVSVLFRSC